jgi:hypothetical protein
MAESVAIVSQDDVPEPLLPELQAIADDVEACLPEGVHLPPLVVRMDCSFATSGRNFAGVVADDVTLMYLCPDLAEQPLSRIRGIFWHEMGHLLQWLEQQLHGHVEQRDRDYEQDCDHKIEALCGVTIYYDRDLVQRVGTPQRSWRRKRPKGLE